MATVASASAGKTYGVFETVLATLLAILFGIFTIIKYAGGIAMGLLAWYLVVVQLDQNNDWSTEVFVLIISTIIGGIGAISAGAKENDFDEWAFLNSVVGTIMLAIIGLCLLVAGPTIRVGDTLIRFTPQGVLYFPGSKAPRGYLTPKSYALTGAKEATLTSSSEEKSSSGVQITIKRDITLHEELAHNTAAADHIRWLMAHPSKETIDARVTQEFQDELDEVTKTLNGLKDVTQLKTGMSFPARHPWLSPITVQNVSISADAAQPADAGK